VTATMKTAATGRRMMKTRIVLGAQRVEPPRSKSAYSAEGQSAGAAATATISLRETSETW